MSVIWEDPPDTAGRRPAGFGRQKSPLGKECDDLVETLQENEGRWARLFDFPTKEEARKRATFMGRKGLSLYVRETREGFSVFGRWNGVPDEPDEPQEPRPGPQPVPEPAPDDQADGVRPPTF